MKKIAISISLLLFIQCQPETNSTQVGEIYPNGFGSIQYNVDITPNSDELWEKERTQNFDQKKFIDFLFEKIYEDELEVHDFFTGEILSSSEVLKLETQEILSRNNISRVQFDEDWVWSDDDNKLKRIVKSVTIAYKVFDLNNEVRGYKPAIQVYFSSIKK